MTISNHDLREIARATGATEFRIRNGQVQLFRTRPVTGCQIGTIENGDVKWEKYPSIPTFTQEIR